MKTCTKCKKDKSYNEFSKDKTSFDGFCYNCKKCVKLHQQRPENKINRSVYRKKYYVENKEKEKDRNIQYRKDHKIEMNEYCRKYYKEHKHENIEMYMFKRAKERAKRQNLEFDISEADIIIPEKCPYLGIPLQLGEGHHIPNSPSLDRIDIKKGYVKGNILVVSNRANAIKRDATLDELLLIVENLKNIIRGVDENKGSV